MVPPPTTQHMGHCVRPRAVHTSPSGLQAAPTELMSEEDRLLELATRPKRGVPLTDDERRVRRRLQYKLHQRRHRAKQRETMQQLEGEIHALRDHVLALEQRRARPLRVQSSTLFEARGTDAGMPVRVAMQYLRMFERGYVDVPGETTQEQFLRAVTVPHVVGPDYEGVDAMLYQWRLYSTFFPFMEISFKGLEVATAGDLTIVCLDIVFALRGRREGILAIYPGLRGDERVIQTMVGAAVPIPGKFRFTFEANGKCTWLGFELDFVVGLQRALGSLQAVAKCLDGVNMSIATGKITIAGEADKRQQETKRRIEHVPYRTLTMPRKIGAPGLGGLELEHL